MAEPSKPPKLRLPIFLTGDVPKADALNIALQSWAVQLNTWVREHAYPAPVVNLSEGQAAYVKTASDVRAKRDGWPGDVPQRVVMRPESDFGGMPRGGNGDDMSGPEDVACLKCGSYAIDHENGPERAYQFCPVAESEQSPLAESLPCKAPGSMHSFADYKGQSLCNDCGKYESEIYAPLMSPRPEWLPEDAVDQIMEVAPADNLNDVVDLITRWYNENAHGRALFNGYVQACKELQEQHSLDLRRLNDARRARDDYQARLKATNGAWIEMSKKLDKAIKERDETTTVLTQTIEARDRMRNERNNERGRASSAEARAEDAEKKLHLFEEAGMDNVRRMERAEAKVAHILRYAERLGKGNDADRARAGEIRQTLDLAGEQ